MGVSMSECVSVLSFCACACVYSRRLSHCSSASTRGEIHVQKGWCVPLAVPWTLCLCSCLRTDGRMDGWGWEMLSLSARGERTRCYLIPLHAERERERGTAYSITRHTQGMQTVCSVADAIARAPDPPRAIAIVNHMYLWKAGRRARTQRGISATLLYSSFDGSAIIYSGSRCSSGFESGCSEPAFYKNINLGMQFSAIILRKPYKRFKPVTCG
jgi:hypothetical protein